MAPFLGPQGFFNESSSYHQTNAIQYLHINNQNLYRVVCYQQYLTSYFFLKEQCNIVIIFVLILHTYIETNKQNNEMNKLSVNGIIGIK